ncbi:hypothetical protein BC940DRAFT_308374 [Gongronella butleri]|nr:hypothetical protein BC940DRAFT_308374 [Gongronella butleri]
MASSQNSVFRQQQQLYRSTHYLSKPKQPANLYTPSPPPQNTSLYKGSKRRASEDEDMADVLETAVERPSRVVKRVQRSQKPLPLPKLLGTLDKDKLIDLINDLVDAQPALQSQVEAHLTSPEFNPNVLCPVPLAPAMMPSSSSASPSPPN